LKKVREIETQGASSNKQPPTIQDISSDEELDYVELRPEKKRAKATMADKQEQSPLPAQRTRRAIRKVCEPSQKKEQGSSKRSVQALTASDEDDEEEDTIPLSRRKRLRSEREITRTEPAPEQSQEQGRIQVLSNWAQTVLRGLPKVPPALQQCQSSKPFKLGFTVNNE
jgi:hypothetical protein